MADQTTATKNLIVHIHNRELESARVARLLHDEVGQVLSAVGLQLAVLRMDFSSQIPELAQRTTEIQDMLERAMNQVRDVSYELNPNIVERTGLAYALDRLVGRYRQQFSGTLRLNVHPGVHLPVPAASAFYKIADLAIENAVRHSAATRIDVLLKTVPSGAILEIKDNGNGFSVKADTAGLGILLMRNFSEQSGSIFMLNADTGKGTIVRVKNKTNAL